MILISHIDTVSFPERRRSLSAHQKIICYKVGMNNKNKKNRQKLTFQLKYIEI